MFEKHYLDDSLVQLRKLRAQADGALRQVSDRQLFETLDADSNSIALIMKHMVGNMRSRWTDFLTSDGEKPDRNRDNEFLLDPKDDRAHIFREWEAGWQLVFDTVAALTPDDLTKTIRIRGQAHTVVEAINRQVSHYAAHVGQIVLLAKHYAGANWQTLSIPKGKSKEFDVANVGIKN